MLGGFFAVWALGPWLTVAGHQTALILPANLFGLVPILSNARISGRAIVGTILAASMAVAFYVARVPRPRRRLAVAAVVGLLMIKRRWQERRVMRTPAVGGSAAR